MRRLMRELAQLKSNPPEGIRVSHPEDNMLDVTGIIEGPRMFQTDRASVPIRLLTPLWTCFRGYAIRRWILQGQVQLHRGVSSSAAKV